MRAACLLALFCFCVPALVPAQEAETTGAREKAALLEEIRERIIWYSEERERPLLIPEDVFGLVPFEELPVPEDNREAIRMWISFQRDWRSPTGQRMAECRYPQRAEIRRIQAEKQKTVEEVIARGPVSLLVAIDQTTRGYRPSEGIYQYNDFTPLRLLVGKDFLYQDPLSARAFLSEGGEIVVDGTRLCSISPWHSTPPRRGDTYMLVGAPDNRGVFQAQYYFRVEDGNVVPAGYSSLKLPQGPLPLERLFAGLRLPSEGPAANGTFSSQCAAESKHGEAAANEALRAEIRDQIIWYGPDQAYPQLIPETVLGLLPVEELPIPETAKFPLRRWICLRNEARAPGEDPYPECTYPATVTHRLDREPSRSSLEEVMATRVATLLVRVDRTILGLQPSMEVFQYNEVTPLRVLASSKSTSDPLSTRAFLSEGGRLVVEGTALCSKSPWHQAAPRQGDVYLLLGSVDSHGIFGATFYFLIEDGNVVPAPYPELEPWEEPVPLAQVLARLAALKKSRESHLDP